VSTNYADVVNAAAQRLQAAGLATTDSNDQFTFSPEGIRALCDMVVLWTAQSADADPRSGIHLSHPAPEAFRRPLGAALAEMSDGVPTSVQTTARKRAVKQLRVAARGASY
jgi:hypothetical protein